MPPIGAEGGTVLEAGPVSGAGGVPSAERRRGLEEFAAAWTEIALEVDRGEVEAKRREIVAEVVGKLGGCEELVELLDFLKAKGAGALREELLEKDLLSVFTGPEAAEAREWLLTIPDPKLRERLCFLAGQGFSGLGFTDYFERCGVVAGLHSQAALLCGYCEVLARTEPEAAVRAYAELGYPKRIDSTWMARVVAAFPPHADFLKIAIETAPDQYTLSKRTRAALLANWAGVAPAAAAQYVMGHAEVVHADQMAVVVSKWAESAPEGAWEWLAKAPAGDARDEGWVALARHWLARGGVVEAWSCAARVGDSQRRVKAATEVFTAWEKVDREAAVKAWEALFQPDPRNGANASMAGTAQEKPQAGR
jgi:hypothetical protein